jgi:guanylate kinase
MSRKPGIAIIISGPSGVGKDTIIDRWRELDQSVERVVAFTTRPPRPGEVDGQSYFFVTSSTFKSLADAGHFLEYKEVHGNFYATPLKNLKEMIRQGKKAILKIDVQGALQVINEHPEFLTIFLLPPSQEELINRLESRGTEDPDKRAERIKNAEFELAQAPKYKYQVINENVEECVKHISEIVEKECQTSS